jgi:hypothetical protein
MRLNVKLVFISFQIVALAAVAAFGQTVTLDQSLSQAWNTFQAGELTNVTAIAGAVQNGHSWGGFAALAYNMPKATALPLQPYISPVVGVLEFGNQWEGFTGGVQLKTDLHLLRGLSGTNKTGFFYSAALTPNAGAGVMENLSGETFGTFKVPGKGTPGQTEAATFYGASTAIGSIKGWQVGAFYEYMTISGISNPFNTFGAYAKKSF